MEPDLARDIAKRLNVEVEFVPVIASNRMEFVQQGKIDLMIATMTDTEARTKVVGIPPPNYYSSGTNVLARKSEIGIASCRERGCQYGTISGVAVSLTKKQQ